MEIILVWTNPLWECQLIGGMKAAMETKAVMAIHHIDVNKHVQIYTNSLIKNKVAGIEITATLKRVHIKSYC
jgi:hypothetical protein